VTGRRASIADPIHHFALTNFAIPPQRLARYLPPGFEADARLDEHGHRWAFLSIVTFQNYRFAMPPLRKLKFTFLQTNYRAYVRQPDGQPAVWFFAIYQRSLFALLDQLLLGTPTYFGRLTLDEDWDGEAKYYRHYDFGSQSWGKGLDLSVQGIDRRPEPPMGFSSADDLEHFFCEPLAGYYREPRTGWLSRLAVRHKQMAPKDGTVLNVRSDVLHRLGVVPYEEQKRPHSVLLQGRVAEFRGYLPDRGLEL